MALEFVSSQKEGPKSSRASELRTSLRAFAAQKPILKEEMVEASLKQRYCNSYYEIPICSLVQIFNPKSPISTSVWIEYLQVYLSNQPSVCFSASTFSLLRKEPGLESQLAGWLACSRPISRKTGKAESATKTPSLGDQKKLLC